MNFLQIVLRLKPKKPDIAPDSEGQPRAMCCKCRYWSGRIGDKDNDLVCAVNVPQPTQEDLEAVSLRIAYAPHDCPDFELKPQPESRTIQWH